MIGCIALIALSIDFWFLRRRRLRANQPATDEQSEANDEYTKAQLHLKLLHKRCWSRTVVTWQRCQRDVIEQCEYAQLVEARTRDSTTRYRGKQHTGQHKEE